MVEQTTDRRRYPGWGFVVGLALIGFGAFCVGLTAFAVEMIGGSWDMWQWSAIGAHLIITAGIVSIVSSRTVIDILDQGVAEYREWRSG